MFCFVFETLHPFITAYKTTSYLYLFALCGRVESNMGESIIRKMVPINIVHQSMIGRRAPASLMQL